jgi:hypothetical protein
MARLNRFDKACPERRRRRRRWATALAAAFSLAATPAMARDHHHWHRWHRDRIDGGDVLAGALILGGIAAIASAASKQDRQDREAAPPPPVPNDRQGYANDGAERDTGLDRAADLCADAAEGKGNRVDFVDNVTRDRDGWSVSGALEGGAGFGCRIGNDGQVQDVNVGGPRAEADDRDPGPPDAQDDDDAPPPGVDNRPVWHGDQAAPPQDDGRYDTSNAPDFGEGA